MTNMLREAAPATSQRCKRNAGFCVVLPTDFHDMRRLAEHHGHAFVDPEEGPRCAAGTNHQIRRQIATVLRLLESPVDWLERVVLEAQAVGVQLPGSPVIFEPHHACFFFPFSSTTYFFRTKFVPERIWTASATAKSLVGLG